MIRAYVHDAFVANKKEVLIVDRDARGNIREIMLPTGEWAPYPEGTKAEQPTFVLSNDAWDALEEAIIVGRYGKLPNDALMRERLDIETRRVDKLLDGYIEELGR